MKYDRTSKRFEVPEEHRQNVDHSDCIMMIVAHHSQKEAAYSLCMALSVEIHALVNLMLTVDIEPEDMLVVDRDGEVVIGGNWREIYGDAAELSIDEVLQADPAVLAKQVGDAARAFFEPVFSTTARFRVEGKDEWCRVVDEGASLKRLSDSKRFPISEVPT